MTDQKLTDAGYLGILESAEYRAHNQLSEGRLPMMSDVEANRLHIILDALHLLRERIHDDPTFKPWEDYR